MTVLGQALMVAGPVVNISCGLCCHFWPPRWLREVVRYYWLSGFQRLFSLSCLSGALGTSPVRSGPVFPYLSRFSQQPKGRSRDPMSPNAFLSRAFCPVLFRLLPTPLFSSISYDIFEGLEHLDQCKSYDHSSIFLFI